MLQIKIITMKKYYEWLMIIYDEKIVYLIESFILSSSFLLTFHSLLWPSRPAVKFIQFFCVASHYQTEKKRKYLVVRRKAFAEVETFTNFAVKNPFFCWLKIVHAFQILI